MILRTKALPICLLAASAFVSGCNGTGATAIGSMTVFLLEGSAEELARCKAAFAGESRKIYVGADGANWIWVKDAKGMLSHYCRNESDGAISAWKEASGTDRATHQLKFESDDLPVEFQPIASKP